MDFYKELAPLADDFRQVAEQTDQGRVSTLSQLKKLAEIGYYKFVATAEPGPRRRALDILSSACGVTSFLSTQHSGVCRRLARAEHPLLEDATAGLHWMGVCFAHLRRSPSPVDAIEFREHVVFSGSGPWFSGKGIMDSVMVGGASTEGHFFMGLSPLSAPEIVLGETQELSVMTATATCKLDFNALSVERKDIIVQSSALDLQESDKHSTVYQSARSLGAARAAANFLDPGAQQTVLDALEKQHQMMDAWDHKAEWKSATELRRQALSLTARVIEAAFVQVGGKAHSLQHPLQRIAREASFYSTSQLTAQLRSAISESLKEYLQ